MTMLEQLSIFDLPPSENPPLRLFEHHRMAGIFSDCPNCGKRFYAKRGKKYCCSKCKRYALRKRHIKNLGYRPDNYDQCKCGKRKSKKAKQCNQCNKINGLQKAKVKKTIKFEAWPKSSISFNKCIVCNKNFTSKIKSKHCSNKCRCKSKRLSNPDKYKDLARQLEIKREQQKPWHKMFKSTRRRISEVMRDASLNKKSRTFEMLGYTPEELVQHIESQFVFGMSWENYGKEWHVDHIKPVSLFDVREQTDIAKIWALSNLMPRWATNTISGQYGSFMVGNVEKGNRYIGAA